MQMRSPVGIVLVACVVAVFVLSVLLPELVKRWEERHVVRDAFLRMYPLASHTSTQRRSGCAAVAAAVIIGLVAFLLYVARFG